MGRKTEDTTAFEQAAERAIHRGLEADGRMSKRDVGRDLNGPEPTFVDAETLRERYRLRQAEEDDEITLWGEIGDEDPNEESVVFMVDPDIRESEPMTPAAEVLDAGEYDEDTGTRPGVWATMGERLYEQHRGAGVRSDDPEPETLDEDEEQE